MARQAHIRSEILELPLFLLLFGLSWYLVRRFKVRHPAYKIGDSSNANHDASDENATTTAEDIGNTTDEVKPLRNEEDI